MTLFGDNLNIKSIQRNNVIKNTWSFKELFNKNEKLM